ncbi:tetratricopeptide repeat protein [Psychroflexus sp. ALD_RP9]|uniref:tetratricopeptide repeat protein n=1 Tax=Psychroflexus sp. ALD_RP9 TaxID=2777186 RepID=UPI001A903890|nr:tetratricopeptide repeat protein [Psychroflexus sp. ALD_RP9]QSS97768.1 tetratricopeptide repeat protein [Psychroflexus sp. ALD_RP9]
MKYFWFVIFIIISFQSWSQNQLFEAKQAYDEANYKQAKTLLIDYLKNNQDNVESRVLLGQTYARLEQWEKAAEINKVLVKQFPNNAEYHFRYGGALGLYAKSVNRFKALTLLGDVKLHLKKATILDSKHIESRWALVQLYMELPGIIGGSKSTAYKYANQLETISPVDAALAKGYIESYDGNFSQAEKYYTKAVAIGKSKTCFEKLIGLYKDFNKTKQLVSTAIKAYHVTNHLNFIFQLNSIEDLASYQTSDLKSILSQVSVQNLSSKEKLKLNQLKSKLAL